MNDLKDEVKTSLLRRQITDEIVAALGFSKEGWVRRLLGPFCFPPAHLFSKIFARIDRVVRESGVNVAADQLLSRFVDRIQVMGKERIPEEGPLIVASNHPGAYDSIAIISNLPRQDLKVIVSDVPFLRSLPAVSQRLIFTPSGPYSRMAALRGLLRHVQEGGAALIFPSGLVDPDPAFMPEAKNKLSTWSESLELMLRRVPQARLQVAIISGVLSPSCMRNPLIKLADEGWRQQKLAEFIQVIQQVVFGRKFGLTPRLTFGEPLTGADLLAQDPQGDLHSAILSSALRGFDQHIGMVPG